MPNDLTTKRNLLDAREDLRLESRRKLASSGFTASTWTLSGVVLVACGGAGEITDALCPNFDAAVLVSCGGGGGPNVQSSQGESHFVQSSPVRGARLYFDTNNNKVVDDTNMDPDIATQDGQYPEGFTTDAEGVAENIPEHLFGKPFVAILDGAINADTGATFPENTRYYSIPNAEGQHTIATPITDWIAEEAGLKPPPPPQMPQVRTSSQVRDAVRDAMASLLGHEAHSTLAGDELTAFNLLYAAILNPASYNGNPIIEYWSAYLATNPSLPNVLRNAQTLIDDAQTLIAALMDNADALIVLHAGTATANMIDLPDVTIGTNADYIATIYAVGTGGVRYSMVDADGADVSGGDFVVDSRTGVISVADGVTLTASNTAIPVYVQVTNADGTQTETVKIDVTVQSVATLTAPTTSGTMTIAENTLGAAPVVTGIEVSGAADPDNFIISDAPDSPPGYAAMFDIVQDGTTWNLVLSESLDYEAIYDLRLRDTQALDEQAIVNGAIKLNVRYQTTNPSDPNNPLFSDPLEFTIMVMNGEDITFSGDFDGVVTEDADEDEDADADADADSLVATGSISVNNHDGANVSVTDSGTYGTLALNDDDTWTYTLGVDDNGDTLTGDPRTKIQQLRTGEILVDTATISVEGTTATKNIYITIIGANEDVHFADANDPTMRDISVATVPDAMDIQIGAAALNGSFDLGNVLGNVLTSSGIDLRGRVRDAEPTTVVFADSVPAALSMLFRLDPNGDLSFTGTSAQAAELGIGTVSLEMLVRTPESTTEELPLTVQVNIALADQTFTSSESLEEGGEVATIESGGGAISYRFTANGNPDDLFAISSGGIITLVTGQNLDYETAMSHTIEVIATDSEGDTDTAMITINVQDANDNAPVFDPDQVTTVAIDETLGNGQSVGLSVSATDDDGTTANNTVTYSVTGGTGMGIFDVDSSSGMITVLDASMINYESGTTSYTLIIGASDGLDANGTDDPTFTADATTTITININDVNEHDPVIAGGATATAMIAEDADAGDMLTTVTATDADTANTLRYTITSGTGTNLFAIADASSGAITLTSAGANMLDYETTTSYTLVVTVTDDGTPARTATQTITVTVTDVDETPPEDITMNSPPYTQTRQEAEAYDPDDLGLTPMPDPAEPM